MATYVKTAVLQTPASNVWDVVSDVGNVPRLTSMIESSRLEGDARFCSLAGGGELEETILSVDPELRRVAYRIHKSPFPIDEHAASIVVTEVADGTRVTWTTDLRPDSALPIFADAADAMFSDLVQRLGSEQRG